ncbi:Hexose transporter protein [Pleurostoma richardsiae]|uniref:Hexose transporter protein n=1 Tax=Pleurostoma richardsiae TaxID=41990 RepID=A0AA38VFB2_9PEZI|nr:Hexose transporter protein [Pleurostoma richardsiae]
MTVPAPDKPSALTAAVSAAPLPWWRDAGLRKLIFWQSWILVSQMVVGYDEVIVGTFQAMDPWQKAMGYPSSEMLGLITAITFVGGFVGAIFAALPADRFGRRPAIMGGSFLCIVGSVLQAAAPNRNVFIGGRLVLGVGISFTTSAGPSLLNELGHPRLRGKMASMFNVLWYLGSIIAAWLTFGTGHLSTQWSWRIPSIVQAVFPLLVMVAVVFMPESPRWLYARGRHEEARRVLVTYHANGDEHSEVVGVELEEIAAALALERETQVASWANTLRHRPNRRRFGIVLSVAVLTLWNGQGVISYYFSPILDSVGITDTSQQTGINGGMAIWNLLCSVAGALLADRVGRRPLWLISFAGMIAANVPLTVSSAMYDQHGSKGAAYATIVFLFLYNAAFNIACNPLLYCYTPEILPYGIRSRGLALQILASQAALTVNQYVNPIALDRIGYWYFVFYLGMLILGFALIYFTFPETKGYTLEELGMLFDEGFDVRPKHTAVLEAEELDGPGGQKEGEKVVKTLEC